MILQALDDLYTRLADDPDYGIAPPGFSPQKISFRIVLRLDGTVHDIEDARMPNAKGNLTSRPTLVPGDAKPSGSGVNPCFLWDNQTYLLGRQPSEKKEGFGHARFEAFRNFHLTAEKEINDPHFSLVCRFLEKWSPDRIASYPVLDDVGTGFGLFQIQGEKRHVHERKAIIDWWSRRQSIRESGPTAQCLISGKTMRIARLHPKIKGVTGAQSSGGSIVSFNDSAYESFGKEQSFNSPVGQNAAFRYGTALNSLLTGPMSHRHCRRFGGTTTVFWTDKPTAVENCFAEFVGGGSNVVADVQDAQQRAQIERLLKAVREGGRFDDFDDDLQTGFYILGLAPNAARLSVRFFHRTSVAELLTRLHEHHRSLEMVREFTESKGQRPADPEFPAVWQILRETARVSDEIPPLLGGALARAIIEGVNYPEALFSIVIRRIRADRSIHYLRAAILKATLVRNHNLEIPTMLDPTNPEPAYRLGRLFSVLEKTQEDALGNVNAGIRDRFYSAASATPASVFPRLLRTYQHHLEKMPTGSIAERIGMERAKRAKVAREMLIQEILDPIQEFPSQLNLKRQGIFAIGYYHQRKDFFTKKESEQPNSKLPTDN